MTLFVTNSLKMKLYIHVLFHIEREQLTKTNIAIQIGNFLIFKTYHGSICFFLSNTFETILDKISI